MSDLSDAERREKRKEIRSLQSESVWLQKAVFALNKAETAREKVDEIRGDDSGSYSVSVDGRDVALTDIEDALAERIEGLMKSVREMRRNLG